MVLPRATETRDPSVDLVRTGNSPPADRLCKCLRHQLPHTEHQAQPAEPDAQPATGPDTTDQPGENMDLRHREGPVCMVQRQRAGGLHLLDGGILAALQPRGLRETEDGPEPTGERHEEQ